MIVKAYEDKLWGKISTIYAQQFLFYLVAYYIAMAVGGPSEPLKNLEFYGAKRTCNGISYTLL